MKFSLVIEAIDNAGKAIRGISNAQKAVHAENLKGAEKAARASQKAAKGLDKQGRAADKAAAAIHNTAKATDKSNIAATKAQRLLDGRVKGWRAEASAMERLNRVTKRWIDLQARRTERAMLGIGAGGVNIGTGVRSVAKYGAMLGAGAGAVGLAAGGAVRGLLVAATEYQQLERQIQGITKSAEEAKQAMNWVAAQQMPPHGIHDLTQGYIALRNVGIAPAKGALEAIADTATGTGKSVEQAAQAYAEAIQGQTGGLKQFGIEARLNGKYIEYIFAGQEGRLKKIKAAENSRAAQAAAIAEVMKRRYGGSMDAFGKTWDGMMWRLGATWNDFKLKIVNSGLFDFVNDKLTRLLALIDQWTADGSLDRWAKDVSDKLILALKIGWLAAQGFYKAGKMIFGFLDNLSGAVGGWENMAMILIALPVVPALLRIAAGILQITRGFIGLVKVGGTILGLFTRLSVLPALASYLRALIVPIGLVTKGFISMGIAFMSTPIGWVVAGIAAIAAGAYLIYRNWETIGPWFSEKWEQVKVIFSDFWEWLAELFNWENISGVLTAVMDKVVGIFSGAKDKIAGVFKTIGQAWGWVKGLFGGEEEAAADIVAQDPAAIAAATEELDRLGLKLKDLSAFSDTFNQSIGAARSTLAGMSFESQGVALMRTFADGIRKGTGAAIAATRNVAGQIRDYLPHSPAKVGPLSDLDKVKFSETLAAAMRPAPAVRAAARVAAGIRDTLSAPIGGQAARPLSTGLSAGGIAPVSINFAPVINISGGSGKTSVEAAVKEAYSRFKAELPKLMDEAQRRKARTAY